MTDKRDRWFTGIREMRIKNYRSVRAGTISFEPLTLFLGPNGSGKSNILSSLAFIRRALRYSPISFRRSGFRTSLWRSGDGMSPPTLGISLRLSLPNSSGGSPIDVDYGFEFDVTGRIPHVHRERCVIHTLDGPYFDRVGQDISHNLGLTMPDIRPDALTLPLLSGFSSFGQVFESLVDTRSYSIDPEAIRDADVTEAPFPSVLDHDGENLVGVLAFLQASHPQVFDRVVDHLASVVPGTTVVLQEHEKRIYLRFVQETDTGSITLTPGHMSDGTLRVLGMLTAVYQTPSPFVIGLEEPESTVHPGALGVLLDILAVGSETGQLLVTTHSPDVMDWQGIPLTSIRLVEWREGSTYVSPIGQGAESMAKERLMSIGEMMRANALIPDPVEHNTEVDLFPELV